MSVDLMFCNPNDVGKYIRKVESFCYGEREYRWDTRMMIEQGDFPPLPLRLSGYFDADHILTQAELNEKDVKLNDYLYDCWTIGKELERLQKTKFYNKIYYSGERFPQIEPLEEQDRKALVKIVEQVLQAYKSGYLCCYI